MTVAKPVPMYILIASLLTGSGGYIGGDLLLTLADQRWVTVADMNLVLKWHMEDRIKELQERIDAGADTPGDRERLAVLKDRLKRLNAE